MRSDEIKSIFDRQASSYDGRWARTAPIRDALHLLLGAVLADLPVDARMLCIGVGTGEEIDSLDMMLAAGIPAAGLEQMRAACDRDVAVLPPAQVASIIKSGGFDDPVMFYQAGLIPAWFSKRASGPAAG